MYLGFVVVAFFFFFFFSLFFFFFFFWLLLLLLLFFACPVRVTVDNSGLCFRVYVTPFEP